MKRGFRLVGDVHFDNVQEQCNGLLQYLEACPVGSFSASKYPSRSAESHLQVSNLRISYLKAVL